MAVALYAIPRTALLGAILLTAYLGGAVASHVRIGEPFVTPFGSRLLPVRHDGEAAMLKIAVHPEEMRGGAIMAWYRGGGAAGVLVHDEVAVVLERLEGPQSLAVMARSGEDAAACNILCETVARLHAPRSGPPDSAARHPAPPCTCGFRCRLASRARRSRRR